jgi:hypothetical protein
LDSPRKVWKSSKLISGKWQTTNFSAFCIPEYCAYDAECHGYDRKLFLSTTNLVVTTDAGAYDRNLVGISLPSVAKLRHIVAGRYSQLHLGAVWRWSSSEIGCLQPLVKHSEGSRILSEHCHEIKNEMPVP